MDKFNSATQELENALTHLEEALEGLFEKAGDPAVARRELSAMIADRARLAEELNAALDDHNSLESAREVLLRFAATHSIPV